jgi:hypothetical protein
MALMVNPNPRGPLLIIIGGFRLLMRGDISLQGLASLLLAVLEPPGDCTLVARPATPPEIAPATSSAGIIRLSPVALLDLTILDFPLSLPVTNGLGTSGSTETFWCKEILDGTKLGKLAGPDFSIAAATSASVSSTDIENFGKDSLCFLRLWS